MHERPVPSCTTLLHATSHAYGMGHPFHAAHTLALPAAVMGGVTRLTIALAVIMIEVSSDVHMLLPVLVAIMTVRGPCTFTFFPALSTVHCVQDSGPVTIIELPMNGQGLAFLTEVAGAAPTT